MVEQWGWLGAATHPQRRYVRHLTLQRPGAEDAGVSAHHGGLHAGTVDRHDAAGDDLPNALVFSAVQPDPGGQGLRGPGCRAGPQVSAELLFASVREQLTALTVLAQPEEVIQAVTVVHSVAELVALLQAWLDGQWRADWAKARAGISWPQQAKSRRSGAHTSVHRLQEKHKHQRQARANT